MSGTREPGPTLAAVVTAAVDATGATAGGVLDHRDRELVPPGDSFGHGTAWPARASPHIAALVVSKTGGRRPFQLETVPWATSANVLAVGHSPAGRSSLVMRHVAS